MSYEIETKDGIVIKGIPDNVQPDDPSIKQKVLTARQGITNTNAGRNMNSSAQGAINALQGPTMGFLDELAGAGSAVAGALANLTPWGDNKSMAENYRSARDKVRGATEQFREDRPLTAIGTSLLASAPVMAVAPNAAAPQVITNGGRLMTAAKTGLGYGAVSGAGESTAGNVKDLLLDTGKGAALSAALGTTGQGAGSVLGAVSSNIGQRFNSSSAANAARLRLADILKKDATGSVFESGSSNPINQVSARNRLFGEGATIADSAGQNTRQALDTLATIPGRAKNDVEALIHARQAGRSGRIVTAADEALGTQGKTYTASLEALSDAKKQSAAPFYKQLENYSVKVDDELGGILAASETAHGGAELLAKLKRELPIDLSKIKAGDDVPFKALDKVKQSLWEAAEKSKGEFGKATPTSNAYNDLRVALTNKMDALAPQDKNGSIYAQARNAFGGKAQLEAAVRDGRTAMKADSIAVADMTKGMGESELEAFRIGALQAMRDKVGTEAGQTSVMKMWKEPATSGKLREIFGDNYRAFSSAVAKERELKLLESAGRGSQTAARLFGAGQLDVPQALSAATGVAMGASFRHPVAAATAGVNELSKAWNQIKTPEATRNELARLLLLKGGAAQQELKNLPSFVNEVNAARAKRSALVGALSSQANRK